MLRKENKLIIGLAIALFFLFGCSSNAVQVDGAYRAPLELTTYVAVLNGEEKVVSVYEHVENIEGEDVLVPNGYFTYNGQKSQLTVYEDIVEYEGKSYVMPKGTRIVNVVGDEIEVKKPVLFISASGEQHLASFN